QLAVAAVLGLTQVQAGDVTTETLRQVASGSAIACADIQDTLGGSELSELSGHRFHRVPAGLPHRLRGGLVDPDVDVFAAPNVEIELVGVLAVIVTLGRVDHTRVSHWRSFPRNE